MFKFTKCWNLNKWRNLKLGDFLIKRSYSKLEHCISKNYKTNTSVIVLINGSNLESNFLTERW